MLKHQKLLTVHQSNGYITKFRLIPWIKNQYGTIWLASVATAKSKRQINDWLKGRSRKKPVQKLDCNLTNGLGYMGHMLLKDQMRQWCDELKPGDMIAFRCESAMREKQFKVWKRWLLNKEQRHKWIADNNFLSFYYYKN